MASFRTVVISILAFTLLGIALGTALAPKILPTQICGVTMDAMTSRPCVLTVQEATSWVLQYQAYSALGGAILGLVVGLVFIAKGRRKPEPATVTTQPPTSPTPPVV